MPLHCAFRRCMVVALCMTPCGLAAAQGVQVTSAGAVIEGEQLARPARLYVEDVTLAVALVRLMESSGIALAFSPSRLPAERRVTCRCDTASVGQALAILLAGTEFVVREERGRVMLIPGTRPTPVSSPVQRQVSTRGVSATDISVAMPLVERQKGHIPQESSESSAASSIAGVVIDSMAGQPIAGARIHVLGTDRRTVANDEGRFVISDVPDGAVSLRVAQLGYRPSTVATIAGEPGMRVGLTRAAVGLEGVVATASGIQRFREIGSEISRVRADSLVETSPATTLSDLLSARATGVYVKTASGSSSGGVRIRIRGSSSPSLSNEPLVYVDGMRINTEPLSLSFTINQQMPSRFNDINPDEIESIDVLKGPSASTMYGTEAANGVILITTKSGMAASRRAEWRAWAEGGLHTEPNEYPANYRSVSETGQTCLLSSVAAGTCTQAEVIQFNLLMDPSTSPFRTGHRGVLGASVAGRLRDVNYFLSGEREDETGVYPRDGLGKTNVRANYGVRPVEQMDVQLTAGYIRSRLSLFADGGTNIGVVTNGLAGGACTTCWFQFSPAQLARIDATQDLDRFIGSATVNLQALDWLQFRGTVGLDAVAREDERLFPVGVFSGTRAGGERNVGRTVAKRRSADLLARADVGLGSALASRTSIGIQFLADRSATVAASGMQLVPGTNSLGAAGVVNTTEYSGSVRSIGAYVEQQLGYQDRLFATAGLRTDRNSSFGRRNRTVVYPKVGLSWVLSEESFFPRVATIGSLRLRGALGQSGSQPGPLNALTYLASFPVITPEGASEVGVSFENGNIGNPRLRPERSTEFELGLDATLLAGRADVALTWYDKRTNDALVLRQVAPSVGASTGRWENLSHVMNRGWEASLTARLLQHQRTSFTVVASATHNTNRLIRLGDGVAPITFGADQRHVQGYPLGGYWMRDLTGFADANSDGIIAPEELQVTDSAVYLGEVTPPLMASLQPSLALFGRFRVSALLSLSHGNTLYNYGEGFRCNGGGARGRSDITTPLAEQARCVAHALRGVPGGYVEPAGFTKLREVSASVMLPIPRGAPGHAHSASVTFAGLNLGTWTSYSGIDPDISSRGSNFEVVDFLQPGSRRTWLARINLTF